MQQFFYYHGEEIYLRTSSPSEGLLGDEHCQIPTERIQPRHLNQRAGTAYTLSKADYTCFSQVYHST